MYLRQTGITLLCVSWVIFLAACERSASIRTTGIRVETEAIPTRIATHTSTTSIGLDATLNPNARQTSYPTTTTLEYAREYPVTPIPLSGPIAAPGAEISGMAWIEDQTLILLPQYPEKFGGLAQGAVFAITKTQILDYIEGRTSSAIEPVAIPFDDAGISTRLPGYEGFESIVVSADHVYLTIEARPQNMMGYLVSGTLTPSLDRINLLPTPLTPIPPQSNIGNTSDEALLIFGSRLVSIYELNGARLNPHPVAHLFDLALQLQDTLAFPNIEYRITDATPTDDFGRFWVINYFYPGDKELATRTDPLEAQYGEGLSHANSQAVERLIELQFSEAGIVLADSPPVQLELSPGLQSRNWEAISRLPGYGFLLATDQYPETILGFVPYP